MSIAASVETMYTAFVNKDYETINSFYDEESTFSDAVYINLNGNEVRAMWESLLGQASDMQVTYAVQDINEDQLTAKIEWIAKYNFSITGRKVTNIITSNIVFGENGKIKNQIDSFDLSVWSNQAMGGLKGKLIALFPNLTIRKLARKKLSVFLEKNK
jgi:hypothetical protein